MTYKERIAITVPNPDANEKTIFNDAADGLLKTKDSSGVVETLATTEGIADTEPKVYVALLSQSGTDAPVATVLKNTLGGVPVWSYNSTGDYTATLAGAFTANKTAVFIVSKITIITDPVAGILMAESITVNTVNINSYGYDAGLVFADGLVAQIKIEVYP